MNRQYQRDLPPPEALNTDTLIALWLGDLQVLDNLGIAIDGKTARAIAMALRRSLTGPTISELYDVRHPATIAIYKAFRVHVASTEGDAGMYFVIWSSDGDTSIEMIDEQTLRAKLNNQDFGESATFLSAVPYADPNYWPEGAILIIKGEIVTPRPRTVAVTYDL